MPFDDNDTELEEEEDIIELKEVLKAIASLLCKEVLSVFHAK